MRLPSFSLCGRGLFAAFVLSAALAFGGAAQAEPNPAEAQAQSTPAGETPAPGPAAESQASPAEAPDDSAPEGTAPGSAATEAPEAGTAARDDGPAPTAKPSEQEEEGTDAASGEPVSKVLVNVDKSSQHMTVFVDGVEQYSWPVSTGVAGYSTPSGEYTAQSMNEIWYSKQWDNAPMPHAIFFTKKGHAVHATADVKHLGQPASHGCVRLSAENAKTLYALVKEKGLKNTQVVLSGETPGGEYKVANQGKRRYGDARMPPWMVAPDQGYYQQPPRRRGLFGRRWGQQQYGPQGYYRAPQPYYYQRRGGW